MPSTRGTGPLGHAPRYEQFETLLASLSADACLIGLFSRQSTLAARPWVVMHNMRAGDLSEHAIYHLLFGGSFPGFQSLYVDHMLDRNAFLRGVVLKRAGGASVFESDVSRRLLDALRLAMDPDRAASLLNPSPARVAVQRRHSDNVGMVMLDTDLVIRERWSAKSADALLGGAGTRLPIYIEAPLREHLRDWKSGAPGTFEPLVFSPIPEILVRVFPMEQQGAVRAMVTIENVQVRVALDRAQHEYHLSPREAEVLRYLFEGYRVEEIANALSVAESTIQDHIKRAIGKAGARNRVQLVARILGWDLATSQ